METIGQRIKRIRKDSKLSQDRFGEICGVSKGAISQWEKDQTTPELSKLIQLRKKLSFSFDYLLSGSTTYSAPTVEAPFAGKEPAPRHYRALVQKVCDIAETIDDTGLTNLIDIAECLARNHPLAKPKAA